ncbi:glycoside hydrolase family 28 protein [Siminovitchia sp. 179-K 8D1 HS]|uniref:glycoside hydrolase family 28 protein n=1 Tax=Siminovitchia sp. 179-K 8D1 HS TaxID=3142385 RepID=UPI00399F06F2
MKKYLAAIIFSLALIFQYAAAPITSNAQEVSVWDSELPKILENIKKPVFPDRDFYIDDFGAVNDGLTKSTEAINQAISKAHEAGGGRVVVPKGTYLTGAIYLKSNVNLYLEEGAVLKFSQDPKDYLPLVKTRWEGVELYNYSPLIYSFGEENIAISGKGTLDGQADNEHWWPWKGKTEYGWKKGEPHQAEARDQLFQMAEDGVPVEDRKFGEGSYLRPSFIQPYESKNILIEGVTLIDSPMWFINPVLSENVTIEDVTVIGHGPNNDGADPESSKNVLIKNSHFDTGDDCIAIKSGRNADGRRINVPSENIVIQGNEMRDGHGGVVIGSEMTGGVRNVFAEDNSMDSPNLDRVLRIKTNSVRGGFAENIYLRNNTVNEVGGEVIRIDMLYEEGDAGNYTPTVRNIEVDNLHSHGGNYGIFIRAYDRAPVQNLKITNSSFNNVKTPTLINHVENMVLSNFTINGKSYDNMPPKTTAEINGERLSDGTYLNKAEVELAAEDENGIAKIEYRLADGPWIEYSDPFIIKQAGETKIEYRAIDQTGNREPVKTLTINIINTDIKGLKKYVEGSDIQPSGIKNAIEKKIENAARDFEKGNIEQGNNKLNNLLHFISNQNEEHISEAIKNDLVKMIQSVMK